MASSNRCSVCKKNAGICLCAGCKAYFCDDDFKDHRGMLINELDGLTVDRSTLQEKINKTTQSSGSDSPLLARIDEWQRTTIHKVKQAADQAREQVNKSMNSRRVEIMRQFETLSEELKQLRETKGVLEQDLARLKKVITQLNEDLKQITKPPAIELHVEESEQIIWDRIIYIEEKSAYAGNQQRQARPRNEQLNQLECNGHACPTCGKCRDWDDSHFTWKRYDGATCRYDESECTPNESTPNECTFDDDYLKWCDHMCRCKTSIEISNDK